MKIKDLLIKIVLCIVPVTLFFFGNSLSKSMGEGKSTFILSFIYILNATVTCMYIFSQRNKLLYGDEKSNFLGRRIDKLLIISQICLGIVLYLFHTKSWGINTLTEIFIFIAVMLYGNYYSLSPMPSENISIFFEDEDVWRKVSKLRGRLIFCFGLIGLFAVLFTAPNGLGINYILLYLTMLAITFIVTYFYAKKQYFKKYDR